MAKHKTVDEYIAAQPSPLQEIATKLRALIKKAAPKEKEELYYGVPFYQKMYIICYKKSVNLGVSTMGLTDEEMSGLTPSKMYGYIKFKSVDEIDDKAITKLLKLVEKKAEAPPRM